MPSITRPLVRPVAGPIAAGLDAVTPIKGVGCDLTRLFANGESGFLHDRILSTRVWQDTAGTTAVTAAGDVVGRLDDRSGLGNHATQATGATKPLWQPNYLEFNGSRNLVSPFLPPSAITFAAAFRATSIAANGFALGGGTGGGTGLVQIGVTGTTGKPQIAFANTSMPVTAFSSWLDLDKVVVVSGNDTSWKVWIDGLLAYSVATTGSIGGTKGLGIGCVNENSFTGARLVGRVYAAMAINRVVTDQEAGCISSRFWQAAH